MRQNEKRHKERDRWRFNEKRTTRPEVKETSNKRTEKVYEKLRQADDLDGERLRVQIQNGRINKGISRVIRRYALRKILL